MRAEGKKLVEPAEVTDDETEDEDETFFSEQEFSGSYDDLIWECIECYLNLPETDNPENNPLSYAYIHKKQQEDQNLLALVTKFPNNYISFTLDDDVEDIVRYQKHPDQDDWKSPYQNKCYQK